MEMDDFLLRKAVSGKHPCHSFPHHSGRKSAFESEKA
jgi:hypothetical protein